MGGVCILILSKNEELLREGAHIDALWVDFIKCGNKIGNTELDALVSSVNIRNKLYTNTREKQSIKHEALAPGYFYDCANGLGDSC